MINPHLQTAYKYAAKGWHVLPVHSPVDGRCSCNRIDCPSEAKHPRSLHGFLDATTDLDAISRWWATWPDANIGIRTGRSYGIVVLDLDAKNGGPEWWQAAQSSHGRIDTLAASTGGGGSHIYFVAPNETLRSTASAIAPGVDTRAEGGYVVVPHSSHISGNRYLWASRGLPPGPIPGWLLALWPKSETLSQSTNGGNNQVIGAIREGQRNSTLASIAGLLRCRGLGRDAILAALSAHNSEACEPPLSEEEVSKIAASVTRYPAGNTTRRINRQVPFKRRGRVYVPHFEVSS